MKHQHNLYPETPIGNFETFDFEEDLDDVFLENEYAAEIPDPVRDGKAWESEVNRKSRAYVSWVQQSLNKILGLRLTVDGIQGPQTRRAIRRFQRQKRLRADGIGGPRTEAALIAAGAGRPLQRASPSSPATRPVSLPKASAPAVRSCPEPARTAVDRCSNPGMQVCPIISNLLCVKKINGIPFEYPTRVRKDSATRLNRVVRRKKNRTQRFIPAVKNTLSQFTTNMSRFGMPIEALLSAGSLYCRCVTGKDTLSNHSYGDAIDIVGVRWAASTYPMGQLRETIVHNFRDPEQRALLVRINACLRLSFSTVIDYHRKDHRDHFHCDMNRGAGRQPRGKTTLRFVQEALSLVLGRPIATTGKFDANTQQALQEFSGRGPEVIKNSSLLNQVLDQLYRGIAAGNV